MNNTSLEIPFINGEINIWNAREANWKLKYLVNTPPPKKKNNQKKNQKKQETVTL